ncbi:uncharacterized protein LOC109011743 [Juglans regia]|uniref:Uncharacterized protein LOC109011743 n=1 Tax=Juglans regia TaxID=51240 RepID=A0A6P9DV69_JUGRE|nr:uncharacterized protein LOC109011743 [Juglans regia]XP_035539165.1 uncharacterized protein LOC109011743 [Juglans regia]
MTRKKRKRVEETADVTPYISQHNLFSYYESKRSIADGAPIEGYCGNLDKIANGSNEFGINDGWSSHEFGNGDNSLEQILWKIEVAHSQVRKLKTQIDKKEGILIHNQAAKEELDDFGEVRGWLIEKPQVPLEEQTTIPQDLPAETAIPKVQSNVKSRSPSKSSFPRHTRRRGRRKAG